MQVLSMNKENVLLLSNVLRMVATVPRRCVRKKQNATIKCSDNR